MKKGNVYQTNQSGYIKAPKNESSGAKVKVERGNDLRVKGERKK